MPGPAGVGHDGDAPAARHRLHGVEGGIVEQLGDRLDPLHAALGQQGVVHRIGAGQRTGVAADGLRSLGRSARLQAQHRLMGFPEDVADGFDESPPVGYVLQVHGDDLCLLVLGQIIEQVDFVDVGLVAEADKLAEAHLPLFGVIENRGAQRAALRDKSEVSGLGHLATERGVHRDVRIGIDDSQTVRADQRNARLANLRRELLPPRRLLQRRSP